MTRLWGGCGISAEGGLKRGSHILEQGAAPVKIKSQGVGHPGFTRYECDRSLPDLFSESGQPNQPQSQKAHCGRLGHRL